MLFSNLLLVSADQALQEKISAIIADRYTLILSENFTATIKLLLKRVFSLIIIDEQIAQDDVKALLLKIKEYQIKVAVVFIAAKEKPLLGLLATVPLACFVAKPFNQKTFLAVLQRILEKKNILFENKELEERAFSRLNYGDFLGSGNYYELIINKIEKAVEQDTPLLISGEFGTEKELIAREIYKNSNFFSGRCLKKNLQEALDDISYLYEINNGTLLLEDLATLDREGQKKLKALVDNELVRVKIIMLSSLSLRKITEIGGMSPELLNIFLNNEITLPPLRSRIKELPLLVDSYLAVMNEVYGFKIEGCSDSFIISLSKYDWPGNLRQLQTVIYAIVLRKKIGVIGEEDLPWFLTKEPQLT